MLLTTGYARADLDVLAGVDGFDVIRKPYRPDELARCVGSILKRTDGSASSGRVTVQSAGS